MAATRQITYVEALNEAMDLALTRDPRVYLIGLGASDADGVFSTTRGLAKKYGHRRVFDMPVAENGMTGIALGSALVGMRPVMSHIRLEFAIPAMDQICNQAAKWHYMFGGQARVPIVIRMVVGRGWGQGPQHSQSLHAWFAHIPGLKVVMPSTVHDAKGLLAAAIADDGPVIFIEHRWLHSLRGHAPKEYYEVPLCQPRTIRPGRDVTIVAASYSTLESLRAAELLSAEGIEAEVIDLRTIAPLNDTIILDSIRRTGHLVAVDQGTLTAGFAGEIVARVSEKAFSYLKSSPERVTLLDVPTPTTRALTNYLYPTIGHIAAAAMRRLGRNPKDPFDAIRPDDLLDVPDKSFTGPF
jgi:acetoin:2,6-dichlorophenolindophenol oxidoreductase subunit beta